MVSVADNLSIVERKRGKLTEVATGSMWGTAGILLVVAKGSGGGICGLYGHLGCSVEPGLRHSPRTLP
jgi:hypothetical protein